MKIQCDVCEKGEASVYCIADEAALCSSCDHRVHHANKLANKHQRFSLLQPPPKQAPLCDICQERRAFLFCQQDRAILCRECDIPIHKANEHTEKHNRFLLSGVKLSATSALYSSTSTSSSSPAISANSISATNNVNSDAVPNFNSNSRSTITNKPVSVNIIPITTPAVSKTDDAKAAYSSAFVVNSTVTAAAAIPSPEDEEKSSTTNNANANANATSSSSPPPTSSIAEYLIEMLPGWHVEDLLDSSSSFGFCKSTSDNDVMPFWDGGLDSNLSFFSPASTGLWVPQAAPVNLNPTQNQWLSTSNISFGGQISSKEILNVKPSRKWNDDNIFAVPQISPPSTVSKRLRTLW